ncbi:MAG: 16S rRNA (cytosine(967)-C(5))-methyltransferase RsmB [Lachnospiraceae bacterium]|nr:16S rRNA (cytosine(967)-C(5))-methyltransferase RsmB [Lachnospiraceae bacterium]
MMREHTADTSSVRKMALDSLLEIMEEQAFCDKVMYTVLKESHMEKRDRSFYRRLVAGTVERTIELDYVLNQFSKLPVEKMKPVIRNILRMSLYQILYMEKIPVSAVCNEAVKLTEQRKLYRLKGFVNGILRTVLREREQIFYPKELVPRLSICYSMPEWIVNRWLSEYGETITEEILAEFLSEKKEIPIRMQKCRSPEQERETGRKALEAEGVLLEKGAWFPYAARIRKFSSLEDLEAFQKGYFSVQDESSMLPGEISGVKRGDLVIDLCAAPGGKTTHAADLLQGTGKVIAADVSREKLARIEENIERLRLSNVEVLLNDARVYRKEWEEKADVVFADLPCSGLGVIGKKCDIKYKTQEKDIAVLSGLQRQILKQAVRYVKPQGRLIYSTCTIAKEENEENALWIEENLPLRRVSIEEMLPGALRGKTGEQGYIQVMPNETGTDGFFVSAFEKYG